LGADDTTEDTTLAYSQEHIGLKWRARQFQPASAGLLANSTPSDPGEVVRSWPAQFHLLEETAGSPGLRRPQVGAVHALLGYWTTDPRLPATVVMPTGTGKTDTMVTALVAARPERLLVVVPSDALRDQLALKFEKLGVLGALGLLPTDSLMPVVGKLFGALQSEDDATNLAVLTNVVVSTVSALTHTQEDVRKHFLSYFSHLFIDEAHHVAAVTWRKIRDDFTPKPVVQFTATPHRTDGQHLGGSLIYAFPLREAQRQGYFSKIRYASVLDLLDPDKAIAGEALKYLRQDREAGFDHLLMARAKSISRAEELQAVYAELAPEFKPVVVHSQSAKKNVDQAMSMLARRESRVLICVDMFGEGFDLPQLKIAALHDQHRSLGITLQFVGRFARSGSENLGEATVVAARSEVRQDESLRRLYSEDADWNHIVEDLSSRSVQEQAEIDEFTKAFNRMPDEVSIHSLMPALSTVIYRPESLSWKPHAVYDVFPEHKLLTHPVPTNERDHILWFVTQEASTPRWGTVQGADSITHHLYVVYWDAERALLYINSSNNDSVHQELARAITGDDDVTPLSGEKVFRVFSQVQRLTPTTVGLIDARNRNRRYSSFNGSDVTEAFPVAEAQTKSQTHIAGVGFLDGDRYSIAGSLKGRVWSHRTATGLKQWTEWCDVVGPKIIDESISVDAVMSGFIRPVELDHWPDYQPLALELTSKLSEILEDSSISVNGVAVPFHEAELLIVGISSPTELSFDLRTDSWSVRYVLELSKSGLVVKAGTREDDASVIRARSEVGFANLATRHGVRVLMSGDAIVEPPGLLLRPNRTLTPWPADRLQVLDWTGVDLHRESWGDGRDAATVQGKMVALTLDGEWDVVIDDDGPGEVADIVALREIDGSLMVRLVHCKYSSQDKPGARLGDFYELAGQAQRSARWRRDVDQLIPRLIKRERERAKKGRSGFVRGDINDLQRLFERSVNLRPSVTIAMAQPGLSAKLVSGNLLELFASVDVYVSETAMSPVEVFCSE
jgi:superfamily II DNA or RNA helicase